LPGVSWPDTAKKLTTTEIWQTVPVEPWGSPLYGDPCRQCGFAWLLGSDDAIALVCGAPDRLAAQLAGTDGRARHRDLGWTASGYVAHIGDNLRIWSEQLAGVLAGGDPHVPGYDEKLLAEARHYNDIPLASALWAVRQSVSAWAPTIREAIAHGVVLQHAGRGAHKATDIVLSNTHDLVHHEWDIARSLAEPSSGVDR
jgi:hypothetical protein